jgi:hypothetical protein
MMMINDHAGTAMLCFIKPIRRDAIELIRNTEKSHTHLLVAASACTNGNVLN